MTLERQPGQKTMSLYDSYKTFRNFDTPTLSDKHVRRFDEEFWAPAECTPDMAVLEIGCGMGLFLAYLHAKGVETFVGIDHDPSLASAIPEAVAENFRAVDVWPFLDQGAQGQTFDRVVLYDVMEHFTADEARGLLELISKILNPGGRIVIKVPNAASPWGAQFQFGDLTHKTAYTAASIKQLALASGYHHLCSYPHIMGNRRRRLLDPLFHGFLGWILMTPPTIWSANFFSILEKRDT
jgi:cyclopropane fatty-acyl-phospholipid synthase-like methyltransferase